MGGVGCGQRLLRGSQPDDPIEYDKRHPPLLVVGNGQAADELAVLLGGMAHLGRRHKQVPLDQPAVAAGRKQARAASHRQRIHCPLVPRHVPEHRQRAVLRRQRQSNNAARAQARINLRPERRRTHAEHHAALKDV